MTTDLGKVAVAKTENSPTKSEQEPAWIEKGIIYNVDLKNFTVDVLTDYEGKPFTNCQVAAPYFHTHNGEGIFAMPEVGSSCLVCQPSDDDTPFVLAFIGSFEMEGAKQDNLEDKAGAADLETEELEAVLKKVGAPSSTTSTGSTEAKTTGASSRAGRPYMNPGDIMLRTRDENFIALRRGGVVQIAATPTCQTIYVPLKNYMRHFAENYEVNTPGGELEWTVQRQENDPGGKAPVLYRLTLRDKAQNDKADIQIKMGHVDDDVRYELVVAPEKVTVGDGKVSGTPKLKMTINKDGDQKFEMQGSLEYTIEKDRKVTIKGTDTVEVTGARTLKALSILQEAKTTHTLKATASTETITGKKTITAAQVSLGSAPGMSAVLGEVLVAWLGSHVHLPVWVVPDPKVGQLDKILSKTIKLSP
jgi:uncharacterized protein YxjI